MLRPKVYLSWVSLVESGYGSCHLSVEFRNVVVNHGAIRLWDGS